MLNRKEKKLAFFVLFSRIFLLLGIYLLSISIVNQPPSFSKFLETYASRWDGDHYIFISQNGYVTEWPEASFIVFLPFYPLTIKAVNYLIKNPLITGVLLSNSFFMLAALAFYKLLRLDYSQKIASLAIVLLAIFPTSYFFSAAYPESLFLLLFALTFYLTRKHLFFVSSLTAGLLTLTKPFGILIWFPLVVEFYQSKRKKLKQLFPLLLVLVFSSSLYLFINFYTYKDPLAFQKFLNKNWYKSFAFPWQGILESWKRGFSTPEWGSYKILIGFAEAVASIVAWLCIPLAFLRKTKMRISYSLYYLLGVLLFTSTGFILSAPRYLLSLPPFFILLAKLIRPKILKILWIPISIGLMFYLACRFSQGQWAF